MEKELLAGGIGAEGAFKLKLVDGKVRAEVGYEGKGGGAGLYAYATPEYFVAQLKEMIPGKVDDMVLDGLLAAMKA